MTRILTMALSAILAMPAYADETPACAEIPGEVFYKVRIALPPDAELSVRLEEQGVADKPAALIGEVRFATNGLQVPLGFSIRPDCVKLAAAVAPGFTARIEQGGKLLFINDASHPFDPAKPMQSIEVEQSR